MNRIRSRRILLGITACLLAVSAGLSFADAQTIYDQIRQTPPSRPTTPEIERLPQPPDMEGLLRPDEFNSGVLANLHINANYLGRAAVFGDDTRLATFAKGNFLPSSTPAPGQPYFGTGPRMNLRAVRNAISFSGYSETADGDPVSAHTQLLVESFGFSSGGDAEATNVTVRQAFGTYNRLSLGVMETAFADPSAVPETLDLAGPSARTTINEAGLGQGVGRISYDLFSDTPDGFFAVVSLEQPLPKILTDATTSTLARYPDFITTARWFENDCLNGEAFERWHIQLASVVRDLGIEDTAAVDDFAVGWGPALSGAFQFPVNSSVNSLDRVTFSIAYGEGIAHYIVDLNAAPAPSL